MSQSREQSFRFACPHCGKHLRAQLDQAGGRFGCPKCGGAVQVPSPAALRDGGTTDRKQAAATDEPVHVAVVCQHCGTRMHATLADVGKQMECPDCGVASVVRKPDAIKKRKAQPLDDVEAYEVWEPEDDPNLHPERVAEAYVSVTCELCETHLSAREDQVGQLIECPDCGHTTPVRAPRKRPAKRVLPGMEMEARQPYELGAPTPSAEHFVAMGDGKVDQERAASYGYGEGHRAVPTLPPWPFVDGVWNFLWHPGVLGRVLGLWGSLVLIVFMIYKVSTVSGSSTLSVVIMIPITCAVALIWIIVASAIYLTVVSETGNGSEEIEWPDAIFVDWMFLGFYFVTSILFASFPAFALGWLFRGTLAEDTLEIVSAVSTYGLLPVVLLSLLENGSPLNPISGEVWRSMWQAGRSWLAFYLLAWFVVAAQIVGLWLVLRGGAGTAIVLGPGIVVVGMMIVYRLLGRLALCCSVAAAVNSVKHEPSKDNDDVEEAGEST